MDEQCFYCDGKVENSYYFGSFVYKNEHVEKPLCEDCYQDWLIGTKG